MERSRDLFLFRLNRLAVTAGRPLIRLCEGQYGITRREWRLIVILAQDGPQLSTALAQRAGIDPARTSRAVTLLVEKGLLRRQPRPNDRRFVEIHLTEQGQRIYESLYPTVERINAHLLEAMAPSDRSELERLFRALEMAASRLPEAIPNLPKANRRRIR